MGHLGKETSFLKSTTVREWLKGFSGLEKMDTVQDARCIKQRIRDQREDWRDSSMNRPL